MHELETYLNDFLKDSKRVVVLGAGSPLRSDDVAGVRVTQILCKSSLEGKNVKVIDGCTAPENFTGEIKAFNPDTMILIDAADMKEAPGSIMIIDPAVINGVTFSTHMLPLKILVDYLKKEINCQTTILGIQPESVEFGTQISAVVSESCDDLCCVLEKVLKRF
jgi:hydrogenase 3 maturation protease